LAEVPPKGRGRELRRASKPKPKLGPAPAAREHCLECPDRNASFRATTYGRSKPRDIGAPGPDRSGTQSWH